MDSDLNFFIFRQDRQTVPGKLLGDELRSSIQQAYTRDTMLQALLRAGELECALEDERTDGTVASVTDILASCLLENDHVPDAGIWRHLPSQLPETLRVTRPEGFAHYALHPLTYAERVGGVGLRRAVVIGIRSIGTTLSAVTAAELRRRGAWASRFTVRPHGNPYDRKTTFELDQRAVIYEGLVSGATFLIVDEGPGLSGSSFLSVAESLMSEGVRAEQIVLMPGHAADIASLRAENAASRWKRFRCLEPGATHSCDNTREWLPTGAWRKRFCATEQQWPAIWIDLERPKYLSSDGRELWKFEGFGHYGLAAVRRARALAEAGLSPAVIGFEEGFAGWPILRGQALRHGEARKPWLRRVAEYCAFRAEAFSAAVEPEQSADLETMLRVNWEREFGAELRPEETSLPVVRPTISDSRMLPHKWIESGDGELLKIDATAHGDDHFFPGPCDVAWDLAGAIVEWNLGADAQEYLLREYQTIGGDNARERMPNYVRAYVTFRFSWARMAAGSMAGAPEEGRLRRDYERYRNLAQAMFEASSQARRLAA